MLDGQNRKIDYLRISVTDKCNLRCVYCMPADGVADLPYDQVLTFEEIVRVCRCASELGICKIKLTGGEPLVRRGVVDLLRQIKALPLIEQVTLTTNGLLLPTMLDRLLDAGLDAVNISLDTLRPDRFRRITRTDGLDRVAEAITLASQAGLRAVKINSLAIRGFNDDELCDLALLARDRNVEVRFIELMPIGYGKTLEAVGQDEILARLEASFGPARPYPSRLGNGPAVYYQFEGFAGKIGFISAVSNAFCTQCNRVRLTSSGFLKLCLHYNKGVELRGLLRGGATDGELTQVLRDAIFHKPLQHSFGEEQNGADLERHVMSQIGG